MSEPISFKIGDSKNNPPKSATPRAKKVSNQDTVDRAVGVMNNVYSAIGVGLVFLQLPESATILAEETVTLEKANRDAFTASPKLAEFIANAGSVSSVATFFVAHVMTGVQIAGVARRETKVKNKTEPEPKPENPDNKPNVKTKDNEPTERNVGTILGTFQ